jgi:hypothetical protein
MKSKKLVVIICMLVTASVFSIVTTSGASDGSTIYVDDDNTQGPWDGTQEHPYQYIQDGIDAASNGDTIYIYNGVYQPSTNIHVYKELTIMGESKENVVVEHETGSEELSIRSKNVEVSTITFRNFRITNQGQFDGSKNPRWGIFIQCYQSSVINNVITGVGSGTTALFILDWSYWVDDLVKGKNIIEGNTFTNNGCGIHLTPTLRPGYNSRIVHNNFIGNKENARFVVSLPSVIDIIRNNIKRLIYLADSSGTDDSFNPGLSLNYWDENYWDDHDAGPKIISGSLQSPGLINQFFHYVFPWISFDWNPASEPYEI